MALLDKGCGALEKGIWAENGQSADGTPGVFVGGCHAFSDEPDSVGDANACAMAAAPTMIEALDAICDIASAYPNDAAMRSIRSKALLAYGCGVGLYNPREVSLTQGGAS